MDDFAGMCRDADKLSLFHRYRFADPPYQFAHTGYGSWDIIPGRPVTGAAYASSSSLVWPASLQLRCCVSAAFLYLARTPRPMQSTWCYFYLVPKII